MDIPGRSVDATLNIQAKTTGLSETADSLNEVRDALSEVAAVSEAAEQQLDSVNDELSRSETEASTAAGGFTALAASMATASQAAESLDDNLDDIDGASVDAFLPTPGDVDDRVSDIEDRISDIDVEDSIDFSQTLTTDGGIDRGDDILTDGGDDVAEEIGEEYEESVEELVDDIIDEIEDTEDGTDELDRLSRRIDELKQGRTDKLSDVLGELSADETELLASELEQADSFQEELLIVAAEVQRSLETESDAVESIADDVERTQDEVSDSTDRIERKRGDIEGDRSRLRNAVDALTAPGLLQSLDELFDDDEFDTASDNLHDFADKQRDIADGFRDVADAVEERNRAAQSVRSKTDFLTGTEDISLVDDSQRSVKRALDASDIASQRSIELQRPDPDEILSVVDLKVRKMLQALVGGQNEFKDVDAKPTRDGIEILATPETETTEITETAESLRFLSDDSGFRKVTGDAGREIGKVSQSVLSLADNAEELNEAASDASNIFSTLAGTVSQRTDSDDVDIDAEGPEDSDISIREERSRITDIEGSIPKRFRTFLSESELTERRTVDDQDRLDPAVQQRQELMRNAERLSFFQSTLQRLSEKPVLTGEKKAPPKSALQGTDPSRSSTLFAIAIPDIIEKVSQSTAEQLLQQRDDLLDREERKTTADKISDRIEQTDAFDILVDNEFDMSDEERSRIDKVVNGFANAIANPDDFAGSGDGGLSDTPLDTDSARERSELIGKVTDAFAAAELITSRKNIDVPDFTDLVETEDTQQTFDSGDDSDVIDVDGEVVDTETVDDTDTDVDTETTAESISDEIKRAVLDEFSDSDFNDDVILDATRTALRQRGADDDIDITSRSDEPDTFGEATTPPDQTTLVETVGDILDQRSGGRSSGTEKTTESFNRILDKLDKFPDMSNVIVARDDGGTPIVDIVGIIEELSELDPEDVFPESFLEKRESGGGGSRGDVEKILGASVIDTDAGRRRVLPGMIRPPATERTSFTDEGELKPLVDFRSADQIRFELENSDILQEVEDGFRQTELFLGQNLSAPGVPDGQATTIPLDPSERFLPPVSERDEKIEQLLLNELFDVDTTGGASGSTDTGTDIDTDTIADQLVQNIAFGVGEKIQGRLEDELGVRLLSDVDGITLEELKEVSGIGDERAKRILMANAAAPDTQSQTDTFSSLLELAESSIFEEASDADIDSDVVTESPSSTSSRAAFLQAAGADRDAVDDAQVEEILPMFDPSGGTLDEKFNRTQFPRDLSHLDELPESLRGGTNRPFSGSVSRAQSALNTDLSDVDALKPGQGDLDEGFSDDAIEAMGEKMGVFTVHDVIDKGPENIAVTDTQEDVLRNAVSEFISNAILDINEDSSLDLVDRDVSFETTAGELVDDEELQEDILEFEQTVDRFVNFSQQESIARAKEKIRQSPEISNARIADPGEQQTLTDAISQRRQDLGAGDPTEFNILERLIASKKRNDIDFGSMGPGERKGGIFTDVPGEIIRSADTDTNVDLKTEFDRAENLVKSMNVKGTFEQPDNAEQLNRMLHGGMLVTDGSGDRFVPPNAPDPTDIPDGMDRGTDPTPDQVLANKFLRLASQSSVFDASLSDFDERFDESNIDGPRTGDVATEFARLGRTKTLEDTRFVDRGEITDVIRDAAAADFEEADIFQTESPTDVKDIVQRNDEELFDKDIATDVFEQAIRKDGGLTKPNINEAIDEVRGGELADQEAQFKSTLRKLSEFKDTTLNVDNAMESLIDSAETAEIDLEDASEELDRLNEALTDTFLSDDTFLPFSPDGDIDPDRSDLDPEDTPNLRDLLRVFDDLNRLVDDDEQFAGMGESQVDRNVADALDKLAEELSDVFSDVTEDNVDMSSEEILSLLSKDRVTEDERERQVQELGENLAQSVDVIEAARDNVIDIMTEQGGISEDEAESEFARILRDADGFGTDALDTAVSERFETQDRFGPDAADRVGAELMSFVNAIRALDAFNPEEETGLGLTLVDDERMLIEDVLGMSDRVDTDGLPTFGRAELERRSRGDPLERLFNSRVSEQSPPEGDLLDLLVTGAEDGDVQETIEKTFERGFSTGDFNDIQNVLDELRKTAETEEEGADVARLRAFVDKFEQQFFDIAGKELFAGNIDGFDVDDPRTNVDAVRPETIGERSRVIEDAFNIQDIGQRRVFARTIKNLQEQGAPVGVETLRASLAQQSFETDSNEMRKIIDELISGIDSGKIGAESVLLDDRTQDRFEDQVQRTIANTSVEGEGEDLARQLIQDVTEAFDDNDRLIAIQDLFDDDRPSVRDIMELDDDDLDNVDADIEEIFTALQESLLVTNRLEQLDVAPDVDQLDVEEEVSARKVRREAEKARIGLGSRQTLDAETAFARRVRQGIVADDIDEIDGLDDESGIVSRIFSIGNAMRVTSDRLEIGDDAALNVSRSLGSFGRALEELKPELGITSASLGAFNISLRNATGVVIGLTGVLGPLISTVAGLAGAFLTLGGAVGAFVGVGALGFLDDMANRMADVKNRTEAAEQLFKAFREEAIQRLDPLRNVSLTIDGQEVGPQELFASGILESLDVINQFASISANILELRAVENAIGRIMTAFTTSDGDLTLNEALMEFSEELAPTIADMTVFLINNLPELISFLGDVAKTLDQPLGELFIQAVDLAATLTKIGTGAIAVYAKLADVFLKIVNFLGVIISKLGIISDISPVPELFAEGGAVERGPTAEGRMESDDDGGFLPFSLATGFGGAIGLALGLDALTSLVKRVTNSVRRVGMAKKRIGEAVARARGFTIPKSVSGFLSGAKSLLLPGTNTAGGQTASASRAGLQQTAREVGPDSVSRLSRVRSGLGRAVRAPARILGGAGRTVGGAARSTAVRLGILEEVLDDFVKVGLPKGIGPRRTIGPSRLGAILSSIESSTPDEEIVTDGGRIVANARQSGLNRLSNLFGRVPTKLDDIISAIQTVDVSINSLDEILAKGKTGIKQGAGILGRIGGKRALLGAGGALATLGTILTRGKGKGLINLLKGGKTGMIGSALGKITGISALRRPGIGKISKGIMGLGKKVLPKAVTGALSSGTSSLFKFLGSKGLKSLAQKGGFTMLTKLFAGRAAMAIPVIGQLIGALDLLTMAITLAIPGVEMFSPLTFAMEQLFNATKDFIDFISDLTLDDIIDALSSGGSQEQGRSMPAGPGQRVDPGINSTQTQPRNPNSPQQQPGMNQSRSANQNTTQTGQGRRPRRDVTINVNGAGENTEGIVTKIMNRLQTEEQKNERFYRGNGS